MKVDQVKSTLSSLLLHELKPTTGSIRVDTHDILPVFQHASESFNPKLTIQQSLAEPLLYYKNNLLNINILTKSFKIRRHHLTCHYHYLASIHMN